MLLTQHATQTILEYLDSALDALTQAGASPSPGLESHAAWNVRMARQRLYDVVIGDVEVDRAIAPSSVPDCRACPNARPTFGRRAPALAFGGV